MYAIRSYYAVQQLKDSQFDILAETEKFVMIAPNCVTIDAEGNLASEGLTFFDLPDVGAANRRWNIKNAIHDMNGDHTDDLLLWDSNGDLTLRTLSAGQFSNNGELLRSNWTFANYFTEDFDNDGTDDLMVRRDSGELELYRFQAGSYNFV